MHKGAIFPLFYLPPIELFSKIKQHKENVIIERCEHFPKQTYRNRAIIQSPQGRLALIVPVVKGAKVHTKVKDVRISYDFDWQRLHWLSMQTSYRSSAYFEYYEDDFARFYQQKWEFLFDYNEELLQMMLKFLKVDVNVTYSESYESEYPDLEDYRSSIHPKTKPQQEFEPYFQVFEDRNGFIPNLSAVDLLFNQGPHSVSLL